MAFLIESLTGSPVQRPDERRLTITKRPLPARPRDFFELVAAMGKAASFEGLVRGIEPQNAEPRLVMFGILGRWPTAAEVAAFETPYKMVRHIQALISSEEFRTPMIRRLCEAFPERQRLFFVRIPRCAGVHALATLDEKHPVLPTNLGDPAFRRAVVLVPLLGELLSRFGTSRTLVAVQPALAPFMAPAETTPAAADPLHWNALPSTPCRAQDMVFSIIRPPEDLARSVVNGVLTALRRPASPDEPARVTAQRQRYAPLPAHEDAAGWRQLGGRILAGLTDRNPICTALGDGTAEGALAACGRLPIQLVALQHYQEWARAAFDTYPQGKMNVSEQILTAENLGPAERAQIDALTAEDRVFYARFSRALAAAEQLYVAGTAL